MISEGDYLPRAISRRHPRKTMRHLQARALQRVLPSLRGVPRALTEVPQTVGRLPRAQGKAGLRVRQAWQGR